MNGRLAEWLIADASRYVSGNKWNRAGSNPAPPDLI